MNITFTTITPENSEAFLHLAPQGFLSKEYLEDKKAVGALIGEKGSFLPAALMIIFIGFTGYEKSIEEGPSIAVKWFMVDEEYRLQGIGRACFEKLYGLGRKVNAARILCAGRGFYEWDSFRPFLGRLGYSFFNYKRIRTVCTLKNFMGITALSEESPEDKKGYSIKTLKKVGEEELEIVYGLFMTRPDKILHDENFEYDKELCCAAVCGKKLAGVFLISSEELADGKHNLSSIFFGVVPETPPEVTLAMIDHSYNRALKLYGEDTIVYIETENPSLVGFIKQLVPDCPVQEAEAGIKKIERR